MDRRQNNNSSDSGFQTELVILVAIIIAVIIGFSIGITHMVEDLREIISQQSETINTLELVLKSEKTAIENPQNNIQLIPDVIRPDKFTFPIDEECYVTSLFGDRENPFLLEGRENIYGGRESGFHTGLDVSTHAWHPEIHSCTDGVVVTHYPPPDGYFQGHEVYGGLVVIQDSTGRLWYYAHLSQTTVHEGYKVKSGDPIGRMGSTGMSTNDHLHIGILENGEWINPLERLQYDYIDTVGRIQK